MVLQGVRQSLEAISKAFNPDATEGIFAFCFGEVPNHSGTEFVFFSLCHFFPTKGSPLKVGWIFEQLGFYSLCIWCQVLFLGLFDYIFGSVLLLNQLNFFFRG